MKKILTAVLPVLSSILLLSACGESAVPVETPAPTAVPAAAATREPVVVEVLQSAELNADEQENINLLKDEANIISDENYADVIELLAHAENMAGRVFQIEGVLEYRDGQPFLTRTLKNETETADIAIPLQYLTKNLADGLWVRVFGLSEVVQENDAAQFALSILAIETPAECGEAVLEWNGSLQHSH